MGQASKYLLLMRWHLLQLLTTATTHSSKYIIYIVTVKKVQCLII